jgi:peroxiredoxin
MFKKEVFIGLFTVLISVAIVWVWLTPSSLSFAPDVALKIIDGRKIELKKLQGQPVLVTFWATTCVSCAKEIPHLVALYEELAPQGLEIVGVAMSYDPPNQVLEMSKRKQIPYPIALDIDGSVANAFGKVMITPTSFLIAPDGTVVKHKIGEMDMEKIRDDIIVMLSAEQQKTLPKSS